MNGRTRYALALVGAALLLGVLLILQPYSVTSPWRAYTEPARRFLSAAVQHDTLNLHRQSLGAPAVRWAIAAARAHPESLAHWALHAEAWAGNRRGETAEVFVAAPSSSCDLVLEFVGPVGTAKIERASSACLEGR